MATSEHRHSGASPASPEAHLPGEPGVWIVILGELTVFALFFSAYLWARSRDPVMFQASLRHLHQWRGVRCEWPSRRGSWWSAAC